MEQVCNCRAPRWPVGKERKTRQGMLLAKAYVRHQRDQMLKVAIDVLDKHQNQQRFGLTSELGGHQVHEVAKFAQALRDVPSQLGFPYEVKWPEVPECLKKHIVS